MIKVTDVCVGIRYSYVIIDVNGSKSLGISYTPLEDIPHARIRLDDVSLENVRDYVSSPHPLTKTIGLALLNAVSQYLIDNESLIMNADLLDKIIINPDDTVAFIGYIRPLVERVKKITEKVYVLERNPLSRDDAYPDTSAVRIIPKANVIIMSGATLINDTADYILQLSKNARLKAIVGATAQILPEYLIEEGFNAVGSFRININSINSVVRCIKLGCGMRDLSKYGMKYVALK
jgi:hypothetical protein